MNIQPAAYAESIAKQARNTPDEGLCDLLIYATRAVLAGSAAQAISAAETEAVLAEYKRRGLKLPFWMNSEDDDPLGSWHGRNV